MADAEVGDFLSRRELCALALLAGSTPALLPLAEAAVMAVDDQVRTAGRARRARSGSQPRGFWSRSCRISAWHQFRPRSDGPGFPANAAVGRTLELTLRYCGMPHAREFGDPAQYTLAFG